MMSRITGKPLFKAYGALLSVYLAWGTTFAAIHFGLETLSPLAVGFQRFFLVGLILLGYCLFQGESWPDAMAWRRNIISGFFLFVSGNALSIWALQFLPTGLAAAAFALNPFWMVGLSFLIPPRETVTPSVVVGLIVGFLGLIVTLWHRLTWSGTITPMFWWSMASLAVVGISWSYGSIYFRRVQGTSSLMMSVALQNLTGGVLLLVMALFLGDNPLALGSVKSHLAIGYLILVGSIVGQSCYLYTIENLSVALSSTYSYVNPVVTMVVGWLLLDETMTLNMVVGMMVILLGVNLVQRKSGLGSPSAPAYPQPAKQGG